MGESSSGKWYTNPAIISAVIAAIITGIFTVIAAFISSNNDTAVHPPPPIQSEPPAQVEEISIKSQAESDSQAIFQDDFEDGLGNWNVKRYSGYNNFMRWHISENEHFSGKSSLALGHEDTDQKENNDTVHIETKKELLLTENSVLSLKIKKEYRINLEIVLKKKDAAVKETVIKFYPGNTMYKDWREEEIYLGLYIDEGPYTLMLRAWDQGSLYLDDIKIQ